MIALVTGRLAAKSPGSIIVDVGGVGYQLHIPLTSFYGLPDEGSAVTFHVHTHVREDALTLFGFSSVREKELFLALMGVSGIGPKLALNIISGLPFDSLVDAITRGDERMVSTIPGVGKKTAARLVLELKEKVAALGFEVAASTGPCKVGPSAGRQKDEAISALLNLGYKKDVAEDAVRRICASSGEDTGLSALIKEALKILARG